LKTGKGKFKSTREFLLRLRKKFERENKELVKVAELRRIEQGGKMIEEFV